MHKQTAENAANQINDAAGGPGIRAAPPFITPVDIPRLEKVEIIF